jgi:DNA-binding transcriptional ArsR family regulator
MLDHVIAQWARLGAAFNTKPAAESPDLELLLLETARLAPQDERVFVVVATWLCRYGRLVAKHRLKQLAAVELESQYRPVLGLLLDTVRQETGTAHFNGVIGECPPAAEAAPLFEIERKDERLHRLAERHASLISKRWNLWARTLQPKDDALRPTRWIMENNPEYRSRADLNGDLRASILAVLHDEPQAGASELSLARWCGATRSAVRNALDSLERAGRIDRRYVGRRRRISLTRAPA